MAYSGCHLTISEGPLMVIRSACTKIGIRKDSRSNQLKLQKCHLKLCLQFNKKLLLLLTGTTEDKSHQDVQRIIKEQNKSSASIPEKQNLNNARKSDQPSNQICS
jgi:hypothetical protein